MFGFWQKFVKINSILSSSFIFKVDRERKKKSIYYHHISIFWNASFSYFEILFFEWLEILLLKQTYYLSASWHFFLSCSHSNLVATYANFYRLIIGVFFLTIFSFKTTLNICKPVYIINILKTVVKLLYPQR